MCDVSAVYRSSSEAAFVTDTINDCAVSLADAARHLSTAVHAASELWTMQVSNSLDAESSMSDQLSVIAGGISEICTNQKVLPICFGFTTVEMVQRFSQIVVFMYNIHVMFLHTGSRTVDRTGR